MSKKEIKCLLVSKFIRITMYVKWLLDIIPMIKKNGKFKMYINFQNLNTTTSKDKYPNACGTYDCRFGS